MKNHLVLFFLFFTAILYSQEKRALISAKVYFDNEAISDVHIINKNSNQGTITDDFGVFEIPVLIGDILEFTHLNLEKKEVIITKEVFLDRTFEVNLEEKTYALNEITLEKPRSIFYVDPEMMPPPTVNAKTLNLPYANTIGKRDEAIVKFQSGGVVNLDNLINSLNGNNKRKKQLQKVTLEDTALSKIRTHFTDDFFITDLQIKKENINLFLNFCYKKNIIYHYKKNQNLKLTKILMDERKNFEQKNKTELSLLENN
jgi:hypothetical protein